MIEDTYALRDQARRLLAHEGGDDLDAVRMAEAVDMASRTLYRQLGSVIGDTAFRAWAYRALRLTRAKYPFLVVEMDPEKGGGLNGLRESVRGRDPVEATEALTALLANFLAVFIGLMGKNLLLTYLREAWPGVEIS